MDDKYHIMSNKNNSLWAGNKIKTYLISYLIVLSILFILPIIGVFINGDIILLGANLYFLELNIFLSLVLLIYTYLTRYMNKNYKLYIIYFILSLVYMIITFMVLTVIL